MRPLHNKGYAAARHEQFIFELKVFVGALVIATPVALLFLFCELS